MEAQLCESMPCCKYKEEIEDDLIMMRRQEPFECGQGTLHHKQRM